MTAVDTNQEWNRLSPSAKAALVAGGPLVSIGMFSMGTALPGLARSFADAPDSAFIVQIIGTIVAPVFAFASPLMTRAIARHGPRRVMLGSLLLFAAGGAAPALLSSLTAILITRVILAIGVAGAFAASMAGIARMPDAQRHRLLGLISFSAGGIAIVTFPLIGMLAAMSWRLAFLVHLIVIPVALLTLQLPRSGHARAAFRGSRQRGRLLAGVPICLLLASVVIGWGMVASAVYSPFLLGHQGVRDPARVGLFLGIMSTCSLLGSGGYSMIQRALGTPATLMLAILTAAAGSMMAGLAMSVPVTITGISILGIGLSLFSGAIYAAAMVAAGPDGDGTAGAGVVTFVKYGGQLIFPAFATLTAQKWGTATVYLALGALMIGVALLLAPATIRRR
ncbi:hypothetical protein NS277_08845 [Novosphingobium barchaimii]|nr:hypothetical protein NS277_08845 [Novosphingobium barchaimii]